MPRPRWMNDWKPPTPVIGPVSTISIPTDKSDAPAFIWLIAPKANTPTVLLVQTLRAYYQINPPSDGFFAGLSDARLERAISRIHQDYGQPIGLADLAQTAAMSRSSFAQTFKQKLSVSPVEYLAKWRMLVASDVLKTTNLPVADVAEQVGYLSDIAFVRAFKREFGQTPSALRRQA
ncbi:MAG: AraC family transcriptional regulator, partial [Rhodobacterales bacterium]